MAAHPDANGQIRVDRNAYGVITTLLSAFPPLQDVARNWAILDNPAMNESVLQGLLTAASMYTGILKPQGHNPFRSADYEAVSKEHELKEKRSALKKEVVPRQP